MDVEQKLTKAPTRPAKNAGVEDCVTTPEAVETFLGGILVADVAV